MQLGGSRNAAHYLKAHPQNLRKPRETRGRTSNVKENTNNTSQHLPVRVLFDSKKMVYRHPKHHPLSTLGKIQVHRNSL